MPYKRSVSLPFESASKLGHLSVISDAFVVKMLESFEKRVPDELLEKPEGITVLDLSAVVPLDFVIAVDGSLSTIPNTLAPHKLLSYIKIAALNISLEELQKAQGAIVNPDTVKGILSRYANSESTVLPLTNISVAGKGILDSIRHVLQSTFEKFEGGALYETLRFLVYQEWDPDPIAWRQDSRHRPHFQCPFCRSKVLFERGDEEFRCPGCGERLSLIDYLGLTMDINESSNDDAMAFNLMGVLEHLTLLTFLRVLVDRGPRHHDRVLLLKDGPLMLRAQYSRLVDPIRGYLRHLHDQGLSFYLAGVEKDGAFVQHGEAIKHYLAEPGSVFLPDNHYIQQRIKHSGSAHTVYGERVLYGNKLYYRADERNVLVASIPSSTSAFDSYDPRPSIDQVMGLREILATLASLISRQHQNAVMPIVAVNQIASMSFYPSNDILERFTEAHLHEAG